MRPRILLVICSLLMIGGLLVWVLRPSEALPPGKVMGQFRTPLSERTPGQRLNCVRAASSLDGKLIRPNDQLSFNKVVGNWSAERGYVQAPVSYDGQMDIDWGGGVCQASSALYNAALTAGMIVIERHPHNWAPSYTPVGRDAAVAQPGVDLIIKNPYSYPVRIHCFQQQQGLVVQILGKEAGPMAQLSSQVNSWAQPNTVLRYTNALTSGRRKVINRGMPGLSSVTYRKFINGGMKGHIERVNASSYPVMNRLILEGR